jgi:hypothetical protein
MKTEGPFDDAGKQIFNAAAERKRKNGLLK